MSEIAILLLINCTPSGNALLGTASICAKGPPRVRSAGDWLSCLPQKATRTLGRHDAWRSFAAQIDGTRALRPTRSSYCTIHIQCLVQELPGYPG